MNRRMFHTQENRHTLLAGPILCRRSDAWLGHAYYFWWDEIDATKWGENSKGGSYQIYTANIESDRVLDAVFNQQEYEFFIAALNRVAREFVEKTGRRPSKNYLCDYLNRRAKWRKELDVILANDNPSGYDELLPIPSRKRIQAAVYNNDCIKGFKLYKEQ